MRDIGYFVICSKNFFESLDFIKKNLVGQIVNETNNSIGSNIFIRFGKDVENILPNGSIYICKEWGIWISSLSWRLSKDDQYLIGTFDESIQDYIERLMGKRFQSFEFLSQFLEIQFNFEDGYKLTTFFHKREENQWTIFLSNQTDIGIDCSTEEKIKEVQALAEHFEIKESFTELDVPLDIAIKEITYNENDFPTFHCENEISVCLQYCSWRVEKNKDYFIGYWDRDKNEIKHKLSHLIGEKIRWIDIRNTMMDAAIQIGDEYVLKTFSCGYAENQWKIEEKDKTLFSAQIQLSD